MIKIEDSYLKSGLVLFSRCFYCNGTLNQLRDGRVKCAVCQRRYSPKKLSRHLALTKAFCQGRSAKEASEELDISYVTALSFYQKLRTGLLPLLERDYEAARDRIEQYEESLYLDHNKRSNKRYIFEAQNFLTFAYGKRVYNILMPSLERYKKSLVDDGLTKQYWEEFSRFLIFHRIAKLESRKNTIERFRHYFDEFMKNYKGVRRENFIYYLKEAEFKFNYKEACFDKLVGLMRQNR